jgi:hypothetical protein
LLVAALRIQEVPRPEIASGCQRFLDNMNLMNESMKNPEIYMTQIFFLVTGLINPNFDQLLYYFLMDDCHLT